MLTFVMHQEEEEEENLFVNQINTVQNVSEETNDWLPKRASLSSWSPNIASLLGSSLLADRCLDKMLDDKCKELELMMSRVQQLNSHYALTIIRNSIGVLKLMHMLRTSRCIEIPKLSQCDNIMQSGLESILNVELSVNQWKQACLPIRDGRLGIRTASSLAPSAFLSSAVSSCDLQLEILPMLACIPDTDFTDNLTFWTTLTSGAPITGSSANK